MDIRLSVAVITRDEEDRLPECLKSVPFADEVVVVDSGSRDNTVAVAESFGCRVIHNNWPGYARQKQFAVDNCRNDWVLILDADERVPPETTVKIMEVLKEHGSGFAAFSLLRKNFFHNRWIRFCGWWPNRVIRLVNRSKGRFSDHLVHEQWLVSGEVKLLDLCIEHYSFRDYSDLVHKMQIYSTLAAREMQKNDKRSFWWSPIMHGGWMFFRTFFLELGIAAGFDGFVISLLNAGGSFMKYAKLREARLYGFPNVKD